MDLSTLYSRMIPAGLATCVMGLSPLVAGADDSQPAASSVAPAKAWCATPSEDLLKMVYDAQGKLRPIIPIRALTELSACAPRGPGSTSGNALKAIQEGGYSVERVDRRLIFERDVVDAMFAECVGSNECEVDVYFGPDAKLSSYNKAKTGGLPFAFLLGHAGDAGHYEVTRKAMVDAQGQLGVTWSSSLIELVANASGDADFYDWGTPAAHAQTLNDKESGEVSQSQNDAKDKFKAWVADYAKKAVAACQSGDENSASDAAYYLGYMLHGVQDLAFHEGITNAQHSYYDNVLKVPVDSDNGKFYSKKMAIATSGSTRVIVGFASSIRTNANACWTAITQGRIDAPSLIRKNKLLGKGPDFGILEAVKYQRLGSKVQEGIKSKGEESFLMLKPWIGGLQEVQMLKMAEEIVASNFK